MASPSSSSSGLIASLDDAVTGVEQARRLSCAVLALFVYDCLLTLDEEVCVCCDYVGPDIPAYSLFTGKILLVRSMVTVSCPILYSTFESIIWSILQHS